MQQQALNLGNEIVVDLFAGGGGASLGITWALGRGPDVAVNHDAHAIAMHEANHPETEHYCESVFDVDPVQATGNQPVGLLWASPDCTHHSKAKGGKPVSKKIRGLAWVVVRWAKRTRPRCISLENVEEFEDWGPLDENQRPDKVRKGEYFRRWVAQLERLGYRVEHRILRACDYGAPTIRRRLFVVARRDGRPIVWPDPTHGAPDNPLVKKGRRQPWRTAAECIDWSIPCPSIFTRKKPLAEATQRRIARGVKRFVLDCADPFLVGVGGRMGQSPERNLHQPFQTVTSKGDCCLAAPYFIPRHGERDGQEPRTRSTEEPLPTVTATANGASLVTAFMEQANTGMTGHHMTAPVSTIVGKGCTQRLVGAHITKFRGGATGSGGDEPMPTVTANSYQKRPGGAAPLGVVAAHLFSQHGSDQRSAPADAPAPPICAGGNHAALVSAFLGTYYGNDSLYDVRGPTPTATGKDRMQLVAVQIEGQTYILVDIGMRMLAPRELFRANGFPDTYHIETGPDGKRLTKTAQVKLVGNSVPPQWAHALVAANFQHEREVVAA